MTRTEIERVVAEADAMRLSKDWSRATPAHFVALWAWAYDRLYGTPPTMSGGNWVRATGAASRILSEQFGGNTVAMIDFARASCGRMEDDRDWQKRKNREVDPIGWALFFSNRFVDRFRVNAVRRGRKLPPATPASAATTGTQAQPVDEGDGLTDLGNARRFATRHGSDVRYCAAMGWLIWDTRRWQRDTTGEVERRAKATVRSIYAEAADAVTPKERIAIAAHAKSSEAVGKIGAMIKLAQSEPGIAVASDVFDRDPWLLNVSNGTINTRTGELRPHDREDMITRLAPVSHDAQATCPTWLAVLSRAMGGSAALVGLLRRFIGYSLTGSVREQKFAVFFGIGANGKSTVLNVVHEMMGDYARQGAPHLLLSSRLGERHPTEVADLHGARFVSCVEAERGRSLAEVVVKQITGGDPLKARYMCRDFFQFAPTFKLVLACNHLPHVRGQDEAIWRRIIVVPFEVVIPESERDAELPEKLRAELPGILNWALEGCRQWLALGLQVPDEARSATADYREDSDQLGEFFDACCELRQGAVAVTADLYDAYCAWHMQSDCSREDRLTLREFCSTLRERGCQPKKLSGGVRGWLGIELTIPVERNGWSLPVRRVDGPDRHSAIPTATDQLPGITSEVALSGGSGTTNGSSSRERIPIERSDRASDPPLPPLGRMRKRSEVGPSKPRPSNDDGEREAIERFS